MRELMAARAKWVASAATVALVLCIASSASAITSGDRSYREVRVRGGIRAEFTYVYRPSTYDYSGQHLVITRAGRTALDLKLTPEDGRWPARDGHSLSIRDLDGGEAEVVVSIWTGGVNCCSAMYVFRYSGGRYRGSFFADRGGFGIRDLGGDSLPEIDSADGRFHYLFSSGADSFLPIRIYRFRGGRLVAVTGRFPYQVRQAEKRSWAVASDLAREGRNPHTALAAWAANKYLLGEGETVWPRLQSLIASGSVSSETEFEEPFLSALRRKLGEFGYLALPQRVR